MFAGDKKCVTALNAFEKLIQRVEFSGMRTMAEVAGMNQKARRRIELIDPGKGRFQCRGYVLIHGLIKPDMAVANLNETEIAPVGRGRPAERGRFQDAALNRPENSGSGSGHTL